MASPVALLSVGLTSVDLVFIRRSYILTCYKYISHLKMTLV